MTAKPSSLLLQFILVFIILSIVPTLFFSTELKRIEERAFSLVEQETRSQLELNQLSLQAILLDIDATVEILSSNRLLHSAISEKDSLDLEAVQDLWILISRSKKYFSHLRFIDTTGQEVIRINSVDNFVEVVTDEYLQNKSHRDYFQYAQSLKQNESGSFGIDVEYEHGKILSPITPALRLITPIDINNKRHGYFIANLNFDVIYGALDNRSDDHPKPDIFKTNGFLLQSQTFSQLLGDIVPENETYNLSILLPKLWEQAKIAPSGFIFDAESWWSYSKVTLSSRLLGRDLILVLNIPDQKISQYVDHKYSDLLLLGTTVYIITALLSLIFCNWNRRHKKHSIESQIARIAMDGMSAVLISDHNNRIVSVNKEFTRLSGYALEEVKGKSPAIFSSGKHQQQFYIKMWRLLLEQGFWEGEVVNRRKDGSLLTEILRIQTVTDHKGKVVYYVGSFVDITQRKELENRLRVLSEKDALSGLWNRRKFDKQMRRETRRSRRYPTKYKSCLAIIDIDNFKRINDQLGHDEGDRVIKSVSNIILEQIRETDFLARIGGEEFGLIMPHTDLNEAEMVLNRLRIAISLDHNNSVTVSGGISDIDDSVQSSYKRSDLALYESKSSGKNCISIVTSQENEAIA
ncbi:sensor domain-containing diguanylate cyclase [Vibrio sp. ZSDE26]|uniref:diguanylate cyclase n=1 Tax=Vibrio amylolyticus TaxID=2847292 RepID=A0A9X2BI19_9VIBR|nr:sensor domain-containing diguanylate cyclase [Vibrio amylolyticus]MCK6263615.1 sensor domain-containing diguanylate cyclase [Vibrio amylolyticus]